MDYALIIAGGSGTRLWPMSRHRLPKQLIPLIHGRSLLQLAADRLTGLVPPERQYICAGLDHRDLICASLGQWPPQRFLGEPTGRDTLNAVGFAAAVIARRDPEAVIAVFTADHLIEPVDRFQRIVAEGYAIAWAHPRTLVTFGIAPTSPAIGYGYLELGEPLPGTSARLVARFKEKPNRDTAQAYLAAGPDRYLWNSGMFVWRAATLLDAIARFAPANHAGLQRLAQAWDSPQRDAVLADAYPALPRISVDYAVMEPASVHPDFRVAAVPMPLTWLDIGSWPAYAQTVDKDPHGNALGAGRHSLLDCRNLLVASSDPHHVIAAIGLDNVIVIHTPDATLVCRADRAEDIKRLHSLLGDQYGTEVI